MSLIAALAVPISAQAPAGWKVRIDGSPNAYAADASSTLKFMPMGGGFHVVGGPAGALWDPGHTVKGLFTASATFTLTKPGTGAGHYGLFFGGRDLEGSAPTYVSFTIAPDGTYQVRHREGAMVHEIDGTPHFAIRKPDAGGTSKNTLEVRVAPTAVSYLVNGAVVTATPTRAGMGSYTELAMTGGIVGVRIDGVLDLRVDGFKAGAM
jgi:hypothetical protein